MRPVFDYRSYVVIAQAVSLFRIMAVGMDFLTVIAGQAIGRTDPDYPLSVLNESINLVTGQSQVFIDRIKEHFLPIKQSRFLSIEKLKRCNHQKQEKQPSISHDFSYEKILLQYYFTLFANTTIFRFNKRTVGRLEAKVHTIPVIKGDFSTAVGLQINPGFPKKPCLKVIGSLYSVLSPLPLSGNFRFSFAAAHEFESAIGGPVIRSELDSRFPGSP